MCCVLNIHISENALGFINFKNPNYLIIITEADYVEQHMQPTVS